MCGPPDEGVLLRPTPKPIRGAFSQDLKGSRWKKNLRAAGRAVEHPVGQTPHLGVAALLAGVATYGIWQGNYLLEGSEDRTSDHEPARKLPDKRGRS
jgi:hypothetical protein